MRDKEGADERDGYYFPDFFFFEFLICFYNPKLKDEQGKLWSNRFFFVSKNFRIFFIKRLENFAKNISIFFGRFEVKFARLPILMRDKKENDLRL